MPDPFERHSRPNGCCEGIYSQPSRSQLRAAVVAEQQHPEIIPQGKRPPGKKNRDLCKAAYWKGPHQPEIRVSQYRWKECHWGLSWGDSEPSWNCRHEEACTGCGKILRTSISDRECPDWHPMTREDRASIAAELARYGEILASHAARRAVISGPQGYRKKRGT